MTPKAPYFPHNNDPRVQFVKATRTKTEKDYLLCVADARVYERVLPSRSPRHARRAHRMIEMMLEGVRLKDIAKSEQTSYQRVLQIRETAVWYGIRYAREFSEGTAIAEAVRFWEAISKIAGASARLKT